MELIKVTYLLKQMPDKKLLVFPTSRAIREYISTLQGTNDFLHKCITIGEFFSRIAYCDNKQLISNELKIIYLKEAIQDVDIKKLGINGDFSSFLKQSEYIFRFFNELASEFKSINDLYAADTYTFYSDHLDILKEIQKKYYAILNQNNYIDQSILPSVYKINEEYLKQFDEIEIFYEGILSGYETRLLEDIKKFVKLRINIKNNEIVKEYNVTIKSISSRILQIAFIKNEIYKMITFDKIDPSNIVIILPDESFHETLSLYNDEKYFNFAMGNNIKTSKIFNTVQTIHKLLTNEDPKDKYKLELFKIDLDLYENYISSNWNISISEDMFGIIIDRLILCEINEEIVEKLTEIKVSLLILFYSTSIKLKLKDMFKIFYNKLLEITIDDSSGGKITVLGLLETRAVQFDGVIVIDFNDDKIPKRSVKDKFLSTQVKELTNLPTSKDREELQKYYYKNIFDQAKKIAISYVDNDVSVKSRFINEIFPNTQERTEEKDLYTILYKPNLLTSYDDEIILDINLSSLSWSATSLKVFLECKRKYYFQYIMKIKEHSISLKPKGFEVGSIIHNILEKLSFSFDINIIKNEISKEQKNNPYLVLDLELWKIKLEKFVLAENERKKLGYTIYEVEKEFNFVYKDIQLKGVIDRIDNLGDGKYEILDYKTSSTLKIDTSKTYENSTDFQLEFYYLSQRDKMIENVSYYDLNTAEIKSEIMLNEKIELLDKILYNLKTKSVNFALCDNNKTCIYCPYKTMCGRD